jgi:hypothetical protein
MISAINDVIYYSRGNNSTTGLKNGKSLVTGITGNNLAIRE